MTNSARITALTTDDWESWKDIRLEAVKRHPEAFGGAYEDEILQTDENFQQALAKNTIFGAFQPHKLVGVAGFFALSQRKMQHKGTLFSVYLRAEYRGQGIADQLITAVIAHARTKVQQLHCTVITANPAAIRLYQKHGFEIYGTEPRALKVNNDYYDEHLMVLKLDCKSI